MALSPIGQSDSLNSGRNSVPWSSLLHLYMDGHDMAVTFDAIFNLLNIAFYVSIESEFATLSKSRINKIIKENTIKTLNEIMDGYRLTDADTIYKVIYFHRTI